jgi:DNA-binding IclR family transcriptional regulator
MATHSVSAALGLVEALAETGPMGLSELARRQDMSKATVLRLLRTLQERGWATQEPAPSLAWSLTPHFAWLGRGVSVDTTLREVALESMNRLQLQTKETVHLVAQEAGHLVLIERLDSPHELRAFFPLGTVIPYHAAATGLAFLSALPDGEIENTLEGSLAPRTPQTLTDRREVLERVREVRKHGFSLNSSGLFEGISSVGAPVVGPEGLPLGALSVSGPSSRMTTERCLEFAPLVVEAATEISRRIQRL